MMASIKVKEGEIEVEGVKNTCKVINEVMNEKDLFEDGSRHSKWKNEVVNHNQNWIVGERTICVKNKIAEFFIRVKTRVKFHKLKPRA